MMFGRKKKWPPIEDKIERDVMVKAIEGNLRRIVADELDKTFEMKPSSITLKKSAGELISLTTQDFGQVMVTPGRWYAVVDGQSIVGDLFDSSIERETRIGELVPTSRYEITARYVYSGYGTAFKAERAAQDHINNRRIVRIK